MPEAETAAPKKRRGRPPGTAKKRHDPEAAPVNGDYSQDVILNKEAGKRYAWLSNDDVPRFRHRGYVKSERTPNGPRPAWDMGTDTDPDFTVGGLTAYEVQEETIERFDARDRAPSEMRMKSIQAAAEATGGYMTRTVEK
jgi:hypothetical protein